MKLLLATDAWFPQVNGVVRTLSRMRDELAVMGVEVDVLAPDRFVTIPCPTYPEIRLAVAPGRRVARVIDEVAPDAIHIATEGPVGMAVRRIALRRGLPFTTSFHTRFPEYIRARLAIPVGLGYAAMRRFHAPSRAVMVATASLRDELEERGFRNVVAWSRGVDTSLFRPQRGGLGDLPRPVAAFVGRVAVEKNIADFLRLDLPGTKVVIGDGPQRPALERQYPATRFLGALHGEQLAAAFADADVFVFPSRTDTFGLVLLEALACGVPVAAYPVTGPIDVVDDPRVAVLDENLHLATTRALALSREHCRSFALGHSWTRCAEQFLANLAPMSPAARI